MEFDRADVVVIGGGAIGLSTAYFLSKRGRDVVVAERSTPGSEASGRNGGWAMGHTFDEPRVPLSLETIRIWPTLDEELGSPTEFVMGGSLGVALTEEEAWLQDEQLKRYASWGIPARKLDLKEMREILPGLTDTALAGTFVERTGQANPQLTSQAFAWGLERNGGRVHAETEVTGIGVQSGRVTHVETNRGDVVADVVVNAAGPWAHRVMGMVGQYLPAVGVRIQILCTLPVPPVTQATWQGAGLYCRQAAKGHLHFGGGRYQGIDMDVPAPDKRTDAFTTRGIAKRFVELVPELGQAPVLRTWAGAYDQTPDHLPIVDKLEQPEGLYIVFDGGYGFSNSPGLGKTMSDLIVDGRTAIDISPFNAARFAGMTEFDPVAELE